MQSPISFIESRLSEHFNKIAIPNFAELMTTAVSNGLVITQEDDQTWFIMDDSQTFGTPDPPALGQTETFTLGGIWIQDVELDYVNFQCRIFGALAYNENTYF